MDADLVGASDARNGVSGEFVHQTEFGNEGEVETRFCSVVSGFELAVGLFGVSMS